MSTLKILNGLSSETPKVFYRGASLEFVMEFPPEVTPADLHGDGITTELESKLRLLDQAGPSGFIADLHPQFEDGYTKVRFRALDGEEYADTSQWPLGKAEFDLVLIRTKDGVTKRYRSLPVCIIIEDGVS